MRQESGNERVTVCHISILTVEVWTEIGTTGIRGICGFSAGMGTNVAEIRRDGSDNCWIPAMMDYIMTGTPRERSASPYGILERPFYLRVCNYYMLLIVVSFHETNCCISS